MGRSFNGTTDLISMSSWANVTTQLSVSAWFLQTAQPSGSDAFTIVGGIGVTNGRNYSLDYRNHGGLPSIELSNQVSTAFGEMWSNITPLINAWHHVLFTVDWTQNPWVPKIYVDGVSQTVNTSGVTSGTPDNATQGNIGSLGNSSFFPGSLADVATWRGVVLSTGDLTSLLNGVRPISLHTANLVGWWPLDGFASPEPDLSVSGNNGTLTGTAQVIGPPALWRISA